MSHEAGYDKQLCLSGPSCYVDKSQGNFSLAVPGVNAANTKFCIRLYGLDPSARWVPSDSCEHEPRTNWATKSQILWGEGSSGTPGWWGHHPSLGFQTRSPWHRGAGGMEVCGNRAPLGLVLCLLQELEAFGCSRSIYLRTSTFRDTSI